jgi:hypothetical protein
MTDELIQTLREAEHEINALRRRNEVLSAKVEVFDCMMQMLHTSPATRPQGMSLDVVYALAKHRDRLEQSQKPQPA